MVFSTQFTRILYSLNLQVIKPFRTELVMMETHLKLPDIPAWLPPPHPSTSLPNPLPLLPHSTHIPTLHLLPCLRNQEEGLEICKGKISSVNKFNESRASTLDPQRGVRTPAPCFPCWWPWVDECPCPVSQCLPWWGVALDVVVVRVKWANIRLIIWNDQCLTTSELQNFKILWVYPNICKALGPFPWGKGQEGSALPTRRGRLRPSWPHDPGWLSYLCTHHHPF